MLINLIDGNNIPYHLIDIVEPGYEFNVFEYKNAFKDAFENICSKNKIPVLCGGSGLYLDSVLRPYDLMPASENKKLRAELDNLSDNELIILLKNHKQLHNVTDTNTL